MLTDEQRVQRDDMLRLLTGGSWDEIAASHDMKCGACRRGMLELAQIDIEQRLDAPNWLTRWSDPDEPYTPSWKSHLEPVAVHKSVTLQLRCASCGASISMPINAKE